jgi:putative ABC transport system permease protein
LRTGALFHLYRVRLRSRLGAELLALAGIAVGVALVFAALVANSSLTGAVRELSDAIGGRADFQLSAREASGFGRRVVAEVRGIRGAAAAPVVEARANVVGPRGLRSVLLVGGYPRLHVRGGLVLPPSLAAQLGLRAGRRAWVETGAGSARVAIAGRGGLGGLGESPVALTSLPQAERLAAIRGRVSRIFVDAAPGREAAVEGELRRIAGNRLNLSAADHEVELFERASYPTSASTALFSALSALVGFLFAFNAALLAVPQRRRLIVDLRLAGYAPSTVLRVVLLDAALLGIAGSAAGLLLGEAATHLLFDSVPGYLSAAFAIGSRQIVTSQSIAAAAAAGLLAACAATILPLRGAMAGAEHPAPPGSGSPGRRPLLLGAGLACLALSALIAVFAPHLGLAGVATLLVAMLLLLSIWLRLIAGAFATACRRLRAPAALLAGLGLRSPGARTRTLGLAATGAVAVLATVSIGGARADLQRGLDGVSRNLDRGSGVWVAFRGATSIFGTTAIAVRPAQLHEIHALPGVRAVGRNRGSFLDVGRDRAWVLGPERPRIGGVLRHQVVAGGQEVAARRLRNGGWATLSQGLAAELGVGVGDRVDLPLPVPMPLRVAALTTNLGWPGGAIVLGAQAYARAWGSGAFSTLGIRLGKGAEPAKVAAMVQAVLGPRSPLRAETAAKRLRLQEATSRAGLSRLGQIAATVLISSALAMAAAMSGLIWQRRPAFAALRVQGIDRLELWRALLLECGLLIGAGCLFGAVFAVLGQVLLDRALASITGFPVIYRIALPTAARVAVGITVAAIAVLAIPGWLAVRVSPRGASEGQAL